MEATFIFLFVTMVLMVLAIRGLSAPRSFAVRSSPITWRTYSDEGLASETVVFDDRVADVDTTSSFGTSDFDVGGCDSSGSDSSGSDSNDSNDCGSSDFDSGDCGSNDFDSSCDSSDFDSGDCGSSDD